MDTPLIVGIIVGTVLLPIYLIVGMIWLNKVEKPKAKLQEPRLDLLPPMERDLIGPWTKGWKEKQPVGNSDCKETWVAECEEMTEWALDQRKRSDENISQLPFYQLQYVDGTNQWSGDSDLVCPVYID